MTALAPTLPAFFTEPSLGRTTPAHTPWPPTATRCGCLCSSRRARAARHLLASDRGCGRRTLVASSSTTSNTSRQQRSQPQQPPGRDPLTVRLRRAAPSRTRRAQCPSARHPSQALRPCCRVPPSPTRKSTRCSPRRTPAGGSGVAITRCCSSRSRPDCGSRTDHTVLWRRPARTRRPRAVPRQGTQAALHPTDQPDRRSAAGWIARTPGPTPRSAVPTSRGRPLSRDAVAWLLTKHATTARTRALRSCKTITPHVLRHTAAMRLLHAGVDTSVIALWLGHEKTDTVQIYLHADSP